MRVHTCAHCGVRLILARDALGKRLPALNACEDPLGIEDPEERIGVISFLAGHEADLGDLTPDEAKSADKRLKACKDRTDLLNLFHTGEVPSD